MITRNDLNVVDVYQEGSDETTWAHVEYQGAKYILTSTNVTEEVMERMAAIDPATALYVAVGYLPAKDNAVFRGDENWQIKGECTDECAKGLCTKRVASDRPEDPSIDHAFNMLLRYLNN